MQEEIQKNLDDILINGLFLSMMDVDKNSMNPFSDDKLKKFVIDVLRDYIFAGGGTELKNMFYSNVGCMSRCINVFVGGETIYSCLDCRNNKMNVLCHDCFLNSEHVNHNNVVLENATGGGCCDCGDAESWKRDYCCAKHTTYEESVDNLTNELVERIYHIIKHLCKYLEMIFYWDFSLLDTKIDQMLDKYIARDHPDSTPDDEGQNYLTKGKIKSADVGIRKHCLITWHVSQNLDTTDLFVSFGIKKNKAKSISDEVNLYGYTSMMFQKDFSECAVFVCQIEPKLKKWKKATQFFGIIKVHRLYFTKLSTQLMCFINEICCAKRRLLNLLLEVLAEANLVKSYVFNERSIWRDLRYNMIYRILLPLTYFEEGKMYIARFYLQNIEQIYDLHINDWYDKMFCFVSLTTQFMTSPRIIEYLGENGYFYKVFDCISCFIRSKMLEDGGCDMIATNEVEKMKMGRFQAFRNSLIECFYTNLEGHVWSEEFQSEIKSTAKRIIYFCFEYDKIGVPSIDQNFAVKYDFLIWLILTLQEILVDFTKWIMLIPNIFDELLSEILFELKRKSDIGEEIIDNICEGITDNIFEGIIDNIYYYYNGYSAIFNFSRKYFVHLLLLGVTNNKLSPEIVGQVVGNEKIVMYIAQPFMQLLCLRFRCDTNEWHPNMAFDKFTDFYNNSDCVPFLNQQILLILQMMASSLDPEKFLKYMLVGIFHFLCEQGNAESLTSIRLKLKFSPRANQHYSLIMIFNILYERPYTGLQEDWKSIMVERRLIHFLAIEDKTHQEILKDISVRFAMDNIEEDFLNQILKRVSFKTSHDTVEKFSLKDKYFGVINPFFYMYNSSESREALRKLDNLYQQRRCVFRLMEIPELISEFEEMNYFIFSKVFFEMITFWMEQGFACFAPRHNVRENLILVLMCISLILKLSKYPEVAGRYESLISYIFRKHECFFHQTIFQVLKKISSEILDPMTHSIIDYILELKGGSTAYKRISFTQELKRSQNPTMHDTKKRCELPWDTSEESDDNQIEHAKQAIPTRDFTVFCEGCGKCESFRFGKFNIYQYSSSHLCFALIRWSRKTNDCETAEVKFSGDVVLNNSGLFEAIDNFDKAIGQRPTMTVSGCSHFIHLTCTNIFKETLNQTVDRLGSNTILNCPLCNRKNNFRVPVNFPIHKEVNSDVSLNRISNFLKIFVELDSAESSSHGEEYTRDTKSPLDSRVKSLLNEPTSWTNYDLKNCAIIYHMEGNSPDISAKHFCSRIISRSISCMVATITRIEKQYRHRYPSFPPTHDPHFNTAAQFSRYCYYTSGLAPALYKSDISESKISGLLSPIYFSRLHMLRMLIHTTDPDRTSSKGFDSTSNIDRFEEFVSSYMAISALMSLNPNYKLPFGDKIELSLVRLFYFLVVFDVFVSFRPTLDPRDTDIEIEFSQSEVDGLYEFYVKMKSCASLDQKNKRLLYQSYVYNILPFLRKTAILFFQLYEMESPIMSMSSPNIKFEINSYSEFISLMNHFSLYDDSKTYMSQSELWIKNRFEKLMFNQDQKRLLITPERYMSNATLVSLPTLYSHLLHGIHYRCSLCNGFTTTALKCLICGTLIPGTYDCMCEYSGTDSSKERFKDVVLNHSLVCDGTYGIFLQLNPPKIIVSEWYNVVTVDFQIYKDKNGESLNNDQDSFVLSEEMYQQMSDLYIGEDIGNLSSQLFKISLSN